MPGAASGSGGGYPLIVMGMHRSGTSLVARVLQRGGVHLGADRNTHDESDFFRGLNKFLFRAGHAEWDYPEALIPVFEDAELCDALVAHLEHACASVEARAYLGWRRWLACRRLAGQREPWGWKDPRNTCTLRFWLRVFPEARVVNVYRNGIDVAGSLLARERQRRGRIHNEVRSSRCLDLRRAFDLWTEYIEMSLRLTQDLPPRRVRDVRYESLVAKPEEGIREILAFAGARLADEAVRELVEEIEPERAHAFRRDPELLELHREKADHPLMQRLEYAGERWP